MLLDVWTLMNSQTQDYMFTIYLLYHSIKPPDVIIQNAALNVQHWLKVWDLHKNVKYISRGNLTKLSTELDCFYIEIKSEKLNKIYSACKYMQRCNCLSCYFNLLFFIPAAGNCISLNIHERQGGEIYKDTEIL